MEFFGGGHIIYPFRGNRDWPYYPTWSATFRHPSLLNISDRAYSSDRLHIFRLTRWPFSQYLAWIIPAGDGFTHENRHIHRAFSYMMVGCQFTTWPESEAKYGGFPAFPIRNTGVGRGVSFWGPAYFWSVSFPLPTMGFLGKDCFCPILLLRNVGNSESHTREPGEVSAMFQVEIRVYVTLSKASSDANFHKKSNKHLMFSFGRFM